MRHRKHGLGLGGLLAIAVLGVMAFASNAQAVDFPSPDFYVNGSATNLPAGLSGTQIGVGTLLIPGLSSEVQCNTFEVKTGNLNSNSDASGLQRTTAVGVYPLGATKQGVLDMAGNVWEWCLNKYKKPTRKEALEVDSDKRGQRVIRGGSWDDIPGFLRSSYRGSADADSGTNEIGFRLAEELE